ncbi:MAG: trypsin-like peptidase domain-containing protein [Pegethrix bostrychoides GSE-TBD4-15B]|jgi:S1-C subfamily serine protease|uniref:Trypsin-like peptidase domain-containing protein n=1 Tax=Pegethrix bostrychoides GSE-TBD4-15B TaxID=2839662 RepID=A0A951P7I6_9CYAN|nr:trypsin-like peptidase domain-containing protein [Pegethrix bostrychoides GSE-TBD4-15B]
MNAKLQFLDRMRPAQRRLIALTVLLALLPVGVSLFKKAPTPEANPQFEQAYQAVLQLSQSPSEHTKRFSYGGISQLDYDRWRQLNSKPIADIDKIRPEEVKAIYQEQWQKGDCAQYVAPLDVTCLDSMISFGDIQGKQLLADLPADPAQAAMLVVERRELERREQVRPPLTPSKRLTLREGVRRDQALADLIALPSVSPKQSGLPPAVSPNAPARSNTAQLAGQIYTALRPSTVEIEDRTRRGSASTAAGVILTADGLVMTNYHVVASDSRPRVKLSDGRAFVGLVILVDESLDLALVQLQGASDLPVAPLAESTAQLQVGDQVYAIGSPLGKSWKLSQAQVIELNSTCANGSSPLRCIRTPRGFLQPGNSGGPLIDESGQVIGINRAVQQSTGEGVSIPVETVKQFLAQRSSQPPGAVPGPNPLRLPLPNPFRRWI